MQHILRLTLSLLFSLFMQLPMLADDAADKWTTYFAYADATAVAEADGRCYAVMNGNLMSYDPQTTEVRCYDGLNSSLSSKDIAFMRYSESQHKLVLVYADGNIDLFDVRSERVVNIPHFKNRPDQNFSLKHLNVQDDDAFLCTAEGVIWISVRRGVIMGQYALGDTRAAAIHDGYLYVAFAKPGVKRISLSDNLNDVSRWEQFSTINVSDLCSAFGFLYLASPYAAAYASRNEYGIWSYDGSHPLTRLSDKSCSNFRRGGSRLMAWHDTAYYVVGEANPSEVAQVMSADHAFTDIVPAAGAAGFWGILPDAGLVYGSCQDQTFTAEVAGIQGDGPSFEHPYSLYSFGSGLYVVGGFHDAFGLQHYPYHVACLDGDGEWHDFETPTTAGGWASKRGSFQDATSVAQDPLDPSHHFVTTFRHGIFEYRDGQLVAQHTHGNSAIVSAISDGNPDYVRTNSAVFDAEGNLFVTNQLAETSIWCLTPQGQWLPFHHPTLEWVPEFGPSIIDRKGRLWICQCRDTGSFVGGFLCLDHNGTLSNAADDVYTYRTSFTNQDGSLISFHSGMCIAEDLDGRLWLGTDNGLFVVDDPDRWSDRDFLITQVKVPRNDGTNYADYLLAGAVVNAIAVDGANRKWIGTNGDGIYVVSPDGTVILHHFTLSDSPLVSDVIWSLAFHAETGEVFIGTDKGLMSYQSRTSLAADELSADHVRIYPNPVRPDYDGPVTVDGLVSDCEVKIVSLSGHVVAAGTSQGGTFTWDGRGFSGQRVGSGVYHVMMAAPDGRSTAVGKIAIVR